MSPVIEQAARFGVARGNAQFDNPRDTAMLAEAAGILFRGELAAKQGWRFTYELSVDGAGWEPKTQWTTDRDDLIAIMRAQNADQASTERYRNVTATSSTTIEGPAEPVGLEP